VKTSRLGGKNFTTGGLKIKKVDFLALIKYNNFNILSLHV